MELYNTSRFPILGNRKVVEFQLKLTKIAIMVYEEEFLNEDEELEEGSEEETEEMPEEELE